MRDPEYDAWPWSFALLIVSLAVLLVLCVFGSSSGPAASRVAYIISSFIYILMIAFSVVLFHLPLLGVTRTRLDSLRKPAWWSLDLATCAFLFVQAIKYLTHIPRPTGGPQGFPSGHTAYGFALAFLILQTYRRLAVVWFALAIAVGWSRVVLHHHYTYQVVAGAVFGLVLGWLVTELPGGLIFPRCLRLRHFVTKNRSTV